MRKPIIGIAGRVKEDIYHNQVSAILEEMRRAVIRAGGMPLGLLSSQDLDIGTHSTITLSPAEKEDIKKILDLCDGVILQGGNKEFGYDYYIIDYCIQNNKPLLGICLGMQELALSSGGIVIENSNKDHSNSHHNINIKKTSILFKIFNKSNLIVNSRHDFIVTDPGTYMVTAKSSKDNIIEAIESINGEIIGVQWHPESIDSYDSIKLFQYFIQRCQKH